MTNCIRLALIFLMIYAIINLIRCMIGEYMCNQFVHYRLNYNGRIYRLYEVSDSTGTLYATYIDRKNCKIVTVNNRTLEIIEEHNIAKSRMHKGIEYNIKDKESRSNSKSTKRAKLYFKIQYKDKIYDLYEINKIENDMIASYVNVELRKSINIKTSEYNGKDINVISEKTLNEDEIKKIQKNIKTD